MHLFPGARGVASLHHSPLALLRVLHTLYYMRRIKVCVCECVFVCRKRRLEGWKDASKQLAASVQRAAQLAGGPIGVAAGGAGRVARHASTEFSDGYRCTSLGRRVGCVRID